MRAISLRYDPYKQVQARIKAFKAMDHPTSKIELIIIGGTFLSYPLDYQYNFIKSCYDAMNEKISSNLEKAKELNERSKNRCIALCIETRPDFCGEKEIKRLLDFGCTRVELGVQILDDKIYKFINRGHKIKDIIEATERLKDAGFKVGYHVMPGLPKSNPKKDLILFKKLFADENFKPDQLKIYPCQVIKGSGLEKLYEQGNYLPYSDEQTVNLIIKMLKEVPPYCRVMRIMREIPPNYIISGTTRIDLRNVIEHKIKDRGIKLNEIRSREVGFMLRDNKEINANVRLDVVGYKASKGNEYFLQIINNQNNMFALCRLRIPYKPFLEELQNAALVRELHVYGPAIEIGERKDDSWQHHGLGKQLMNKAEEIAKKEGCKKIAVISGVGAREYYKKIGYKLENAYMVKNL